MSQISTKGLVRKIIKSEYFEGGCDFEQKFYEKVKEKFYKEELSSVFLLLCPQNKVQITNLNLST